MGCKRKGVSGGRKGERREKDAERGALRRREGVRRAGERDARAYVWIVGAHWGSGVARGRDVSRKRGSVGHQGDDSDQLQWCKSTSRFCLHPRAASLPYIAGIYSTCFVAVDDVEYSSGPRTSRRVLEAERRLGTDAWAGSVS